MVVMVVIPLMPEMVILHLVSAAKTIPKIGPLVARPVRMTELIVPAWVGVPVCIDVVTRGLNPVLESAVPCPRPAARRLHRMPRALTRRPVLRVSRKCCSGGKCETCNQRDR